MRWLIVVAALGAGLAVSAAADDASLNDICNRSARYLFAEQQIHFRAASADPEPGAAAVIDSLAEIAAGCPASELVILGHTDNRGSEALNVALSTRRATFVAAALAARGLHAARIVAIGRGSAAPIASNESRDGRRLNRRIEVRFRLPDAARDQS